MGTAIEPFKIAITDAVLADLQARLRHTRIRHWNEMPRGGHFPAFEQPGLIVEELRTFVRTLR